MQSNDGRRDVSALSEWLGAWQPIETAPRDGTWVLLSGGECDHDEESDAKTRSVVGQWSNYCNGSTVDWHWQFAWYDGGYYGEYKKPTHWMPLPAPPQSA
jgi:hypothetical protein